MAFPAGRAAQGNRRKIGRARHADLRVRLRNATFSSGDVGTAFEEFRRNAEGNGDGFCDEWIDFDGKCRSRFAEQGCEGMFEQRALDADVGGLRQRGVELRFGLRDILAGRHARVILGLGLPNQSSTAL